MKRRSGFTLIELLVVIAIIAILAGLILAAVLLFLNKGTDAQARNEMLQLAGALQKFKAKYGQYPPSTFRVRARLADYSGVDQLDKDSASFLSSVMFPNLPPGTSVPWAGFNGVKPVPIPAPGIVLEGDQCLMFFLCGPPNQGGNAAAGFMGGFSNDPANPVGATSTPIRFMDLPNAGRLTIRQNINPPNPVSVAQLFPSYVDAYGTQPYMYFAPVKGRPDGYMNYYPNSLGVNPYAKNATQFYNSDSFQLICAGKDGLFGPGGVWPQGSSTGVGADDLSNFNGDKMLGIQ